MINISDLSITIIIVSSKSSKNGQYKDTFILLFLFIFIFCGMGFILRIAFNVFVRAISLFKKKWSDIHNIFFLCYNFSVYLFMPEDTNSSTNLLDERIKTPFILDIPLAFRQQIFKDFRGKISSHIF